MPSVALQISTTLRHQNILLVRLQVRIMAIKLTPGQTRQEFGMQGKMKKLQHTTVVLPPHPPDAQEGARIALREIDALTEGETLSTYCRVLPALH
jgi:hypothetical protein